MYTIVLRKKHEDKLEKSAMLKITEIQYKLYKIGEKVSELDELSLILTSKDFINCSKLLMEIYKRIGESIQSIQDFSISSSRIMGLEIGPLRIILPWNINLNLGKTHSKKILDSLLAELECFIGKCISAQNTLSGLENLHSPKENNLIDLSNQSEWSSEILLEVIANLKSALDDNLDAILILQSLIEWDYQNRFSVGESDNSDFYIDANNNSITFYGADNNDRRIDIPTATISSRGFNEKSTLFSRKNHRWTKSFVFSVIFCGIIFLFGLYLFGL